MSDESREVFHKVTAALDAAGVTYVHMQHDPVYTSEEAAAVRGTPLCSGAKALVLKSEKGFVMAVMPADRALHGNALRRFLGCRRLRFARREELLELTGLTPGSVPPLGSLFGLRTVCDAHLANNERINFNAGSHANSLQLDYQDWLAFESPDVVEITRKE